MDSEDKGDVYHRKIDELSELFKESKLGYHSILDHDGLVLLVKRDGNNGFMDFMSEVHGEFDDLREMLPLSAQIKVTGIRFAVETTDMISKSLIHDLVERYGNVSTHVPYDAASGNYVMNLFSQLPDYYNEDFMEFLDLYPDFLRKKYQWMMKK